MKKFGINTLRMCHVLLLMTALLMATQIVQADPHSGQSSNVAIIGSPGVINGGSFPTTGVDFAAFTFTNLDPANVNAANLASYDTVLLNVASSEIGCDVNTLSATAKADLVTFVNNGGKLIIYDSECSTQNYGWLPYTFTTNNPGQMGAQGTLTITEENILSTSISGDTHYIDYLALGSNTDAVGDMNVMTTLDSNWCLDMSGTNINLVTGPVHTYAKYGTGFLIYNGMDMDYLSSYYPANGLEKIWVQELQAASALLPCGITVVGITLTPHNSTNEVGQTHTVTAKLTDLLGNPQPNISVTFSIISGPNSPFNASGTTNASGQATFTYTGTGGVGIDEIRACFNNQASQVVCSQIVTKEWITPTKLIEGRMTGGGNVLMSTGAKVTHGFELQCDAKKAPNNLEVNWGKGNKFHLENLTTATCSDDPAIVPNPPVAGFDTYKGIGIGQYNGVSGATAEWTFTDAGEPGKKDIAAIVIKDASSNIVLTVSGHLNSGNQQAHKE